MTSVSRTAGRQLRIIVLGSLVRFPLGGIAWHHMQYVMGLARLGHDVHFAEDSNDYEWSCYDPSRNLTDKDPTYGLRFAAEMFERVGLADRWSYYDAHTASWFGPCGDRVKRLAKSADMLLNLGHSNPMRPWMRDIPVRALVDTDPGFTQVRLLTTPSMRERAEAHTAFFSFGENIWSGRSLIPDDGFCWHPTRQPVVVDVWAVTPGPRAGSFTTVMQWESYPVREFEGGAYGMKAMAFIPYADLPRRTGESLEMAVGGGTAPRQQLLASGWLLRDPVEITRDPWTYQQYIRASKAEFTVAKDGYVTGRSGWFSERSAAYLASGRPVVTQETGFSDVIRVGEGVMSFTSPDEAIAMIEEVATRYDFHCRAAREVAEAEFDAGKVLTRLIETAMSADTEPRPSPLHRELKA